MKVVEAAGNAPAWACLQGRCITLLPHPHWQAVWVLPPASRVLETPPHCWCPACTEIERAGSVRTLPARAISTKNKHLLVIYSIPTRGFTAVVSVFPFDRLRVHPERRAERGVEGFRGTPPPKPFRCKSRPDTFGVLVSDRGADPIGGEPRLSHA